jgi:large repetitive protein
MSTPAGIDCGTDCNQPYDLGTNVTLTADPGQSSTFGGWSGACGGSDLTCSIVMNASKSVTATFVSKPLLTVTPSGTGSGTVTSNPAGINCPADCSEYYDTGTPVTLMATPAAGSTFTGWSVDCSGLLTCSLTMNGNKSVTATFEPLVPTGPTGPMPTGTR